MAAALPFVFGLSQEISQEKRLATQFTIKVYDSVSGEAVPDAAVEMYRRNTQSGIPMHLLTSTTDSNGMVIFTNANMGIYGNMPKNPGLLSPGMNGIPERSRLCGGAEVNQA
jgi:hypothetical protein